MISQQYAKLNARGQRSYNNRGLVNDARLWASASIFLTEAWPGIYCLLTKRQDTRLNAASIAAL